MPYIDEPAKIPWYLRWGIRLAERKTGKNMMPGRLLSWYPKAALGAGVLESLVAHEDREVPVRLLKLIRIQVSFSASCTFCIDMNSFQFENYDISEEEILFLQNPRGVAACPTFSPGEKSALDYVRQITATPISLEEKTIKTLKSNFSPRAIVIIASTAAQVNFWTRLIQGLGIAPAGFHETCTVLNLDRYGTLRKESNEN